LVVLSYQIQYTFTFHPPAFFYGNHP
jgi:hypothetical protein